MIQDDHPWEDSVRLFETSTLPYLKNQGKFIGELASGGDELCVNIIQKYNMLYKSFDPVTHIILREYLEKFGERYNQ